MIVSRKLLAGWRSLMLGAVFIELASAAPEAAAADLLNRIKQKGTITVGTEAAFPPFEFVQDGKIVGYGKDILDYVVAGLGVKLNQLDVPFQGIMPGLQTGKFDLVATSILLTPERAKQFAFTMPIADGTMHVLKRKGDASITSSADLAGKRVGTQLGTTAEKDFKDLEQDLKKAGKPGFAELRLFTAMPEAYLALANQQVAAVAAPLPSLANVMQQRPGLYELVGPVGASKVYISWITRNEDTDLRNYIDAKIKELHTSGKLAELQKKWFGFTMEVPTANYLPAGAK